MAESKIVGSDGNPSDLDLFGNPLEPLRDRRGRPSFRKDKENQDFVAVRAAAGWSQKMIASAIGCDEKTLRKYFSRELENGALIVEGLCLDILMRKIREGHSPSIRQMKERLDMVAPRAPKAPRGDDDPAGEGDKQAPMGKKEQRLAEAQVVPDDWGNIQARRSRH